MEHPISSLIAGAETGDRPAADALFAALYSELHRLASAQLARNAGNVRAASIQGPDILSINNEWSEPTSVLSPGVGDRVWLDADGDGIQEPAEPGVPDVLVAVFSFMGMLQGATITDSSGHYSLDGLAFNGGYYLKFFPEAVTVSADGNNYPILHYQDGNQPSQVTGYNIYRASNPAPGSWPMVASDVIDMDAGVPNKQWVDTSGAVPPTGIWYYRVRGWNSRCMAEGP